MRIRKRFESLSAAATVQPPLDLHADVYRQPLLLVQQPELHPNWNPRVLYDENKYQSFDPPQPPSSDHTTRIGLRPSTWVSSGNGSEPTELAVFAQKESEKKEIIKHNHFGRKESSLSAEGSSNHLGWLEGDRLIPIKKRRGCFGKTEENKMSEGTTKPQLQTNERSVATQEVSATSFTTNKKNGKRGNVIMEGSRCSRVNGRGWRCCQQTLVGYSLCEHHLGKGRLNYMTSIGGRAQKIASKQQDTEDEDEDEDGGHDEYETFMDDTMKCSKKKKVGVVKARSLSSLLSQISSS